MRIIAGLFKGRKLRLPTWGGLRPTSDKLRETLFNVLRDRVAGARVLDAYAGTGAVGLEALSRGAAHVTFVERDERGVALIHQNAALCGIDAGYTVVTGDFVRLSQRLCSMELFDVVLLDPPYATDDAVRALGMAAELVQPTGVVVLEQSSRRAAAVDSRLEPTRELRSGDSTLLFLKPALSAHGADPVHGPRTGA